MSTTVLMAISLKVKSAIVATTVVATATPSTPHAGWHGVYQCLASSLHLAGECVPPLCDVQDSSSGEDQVVQEWLHFLNVLCEALLQTLGPSPSICDPGSILQKDLLFVDLHYPTCINVGHGADDVRLPLLQETVGHFGVDHFFPSSSTCSCIRNKDMVCCV